MAKRDFSILLEKVVTGSSKKDIGTVSGFNAYAQYIEVVLKTQKGELISNMNLGSNYFDYIFNGQANFPALQTSLAAYIQAAIPKIYNVSVQANYATLDTFEFTVIYSITDGIAKQENITTFVEVST
jgi:phage baseplate assembly protein W